MIMMKTMSKCHYCWSHSPTPKGNDDNMCIDIYLQTEIRKLVLFSSSIIHAHILISGAPDYAYQYTRMSPLFYNVFTFYIIIFFPFVHNTLYSFNEAAFSQVNLYIGNIYCNSRTATSNEKSTPELIVMITLKEMLILIKPMAIVIVITMKWQCVQCFYVSIEQFLLERKKCRTFIYFILFWCASSLPK